MPFYEGFTIGTVASTILQTPPNYSFLIRDMYVGNSSTVANANDTAVLQAVKQYAGTITGTVTLAILPQDQGSTPYRDHESMMVPAGAYLTASSTFGNITLTIGGTYIFYRE